jgi:GrpB-like predicted nucleotidyltransferase (UPF0157 family)
MHWFCKPHPSHRTAPPAPDAERLARYLNVLTFRDYLRQQPDAVADYEALKRELADRCPHDREADTEGKTDLIGKLVLQRHFADRLPGLWI